MKNRINPFLRHSASIAMSLATIGLGDAADLDWEGDVSSDFQVGTNWEGNSLPNFGTDILRFKNNSAPTTVTNVNVTLTNTGTAAGTSLSQILFEGSAPAFTLGNSSNTITLGTAASNTYNNAIVLSSGSTVIQTIGSNIVIDDGKAYTASVVNSSTDGGLLKFTGNITGGTGAVTPGAIAFGFGNTSTHNGNYEVTGNITPGGATAMNVTLRGTGSLTLSGNNTINHLSFNTDTASTAVIRINGGTTNLVTLPYQSSGNGLGTQTLRVSAGTLNVSGSARGLRTSLTVDGGTMNLNGAERLSFNGAAGQTLNISAGELNYNWSTGVRLGNSSGNTANQAGNYDFTATQSGGTFKILGGGGATSTLTLGGSDNTSKTIAYNLSGGVLDVRGSNDTNGHIVLGAGTDAVTGGSSTLALSGTGKLISRFNPGLSGGIAGAQTGAAQVLSLTGGTLVAGRIDATNLRGTLAGANGTIVNAGSTFAPGDVGTVGRTNLVGNMSVSSGSITIDLGGLAASSVFSEAANLGTFDNLLISGNLSLGGNLGLNLVNGYVPDFADTFRIIDVGGTLSNFFGNVSDGGTLATLGNEGTFKVYSSGNDVFLSEFTVIPEPRAALLGSLGLLALLRRRR